MLTALNAWYGFDKLLEQWRVVYVSLTNNCSGKRFVKKNLQMSVWKKCYKNRQKFIIIHILSKFIISKILKLCLYLLGNIILIILPSKWSKYDQNWQSYKLSCITRKKYESHIKFSLFCQKHANKEYLDTISKLLNVHFLLLRVFSWI